MGHLLARAARDFSMICLLFAPKVKNLLARRGNCLAAPACPKMLMDMWPLQAPKYWNMLEIDGSRRCWVNMFHYCTSPYLGVGSAQGPCSDSKVIARTVLRRAQQHTSTRSAARGERQTRAAKAAHLRGEVVRRRARAHRQPAG